MASFAMATRNSSDIEPLRDLLTSYREDSNGPVKTMPAQFYTSEAFHRFENDHLFRKEWICLGHVGEIPRAGDFFTTELVDEMLLVVRDHEAVPRVLSNVCRHRGHPVAEGKGNRRRFVCPYHAWSYGCDGALLNAPFMQKVEAFDKRKIRLPELRSEIWKGFIFVNLDGQAPPLDVRLHDLERTASNYHLGERHLLFQEEDTWQTNWKCLTENFMEGYHLSITHAKTLHHITPTALCRKLPGGEGYTAYVSGYDPDFPDREPYHPDLTPEERRQSLLFCIYPSFVITCAPNFSLYMCLRPETADAVTLRWGVIGYVDDPEHPAAQEYLSIGRAFNAEDREKLESLQRALRTKFYEPGFLAPDDLEGTVRDFHRYLAGRLGSHVSLT
jgi:phenylpropionate dioxygenase-like ring-hydroxylating dioxygenase large terminal subunit